MGIGLNGYCRVTIWINYVGANWYEWVTSADDLEDTEVSL